ALFLSCALSIVMPTRSATLCIHPMSSSFTASPPVQSVSARAPTMAGPDRIGTTSIEINSTAIGMACSLVYVWPKTESIDRRLWTGLFDTNYGVHATSHPHEI